MTTSPDKPAASSSPSRRALLAGAVGGIGAVAAGAVARVSPARGANGDPIVIGSNNAASAQTRLTSSAPNAAAFWADGGTGTSYGVIGTTGSGYGVYGSATSGTAAFGTSSSGYGVRGSSGSGVGVSGESSSGIGVAAFSSASGQPALRSWSTASTGVVGAAGLGLPNPRPNTGVFGYAVQDGASRGVFGRANAGHGVHGQATGGVGVYGAATKGIAIQGSGRVKFGKVSGVATIAAGNTSVLVNPGVNVTSGSFVLLTPRANIGSRGLWFTTNATANTLTIHVSATRTSATKVAWLLLG